jgi:hypothetical protein
VRSRFKELPSNYEEEQAKKRRLTMGETIDLLRKAKRRKVDWAQETEGWMSRLDEELMETLKKSQDLRLRLTKPRLKAPRRLWIEVWTNPVVNRWKQMKIEVGPRCAMEEVYRKVRSRRKDRWKVQWDEDQMDPWQAWGIEGQLGRIEDREWIEGERTALVIQEEGSSFMEEMQLGSEKWKKRLLVGKNGSENSGLSGEKKTLIGRLSGDRQTGGSQGKSNGSREKTTGEKRSGGKAQ